MNAPIDVSIVIPTRNRWHFLSSHALPSALAQQEVDVEVIVVDDGSTDETLGGLARINDVRLRILRNERARGVSGARNTGVDAARADWLAFLDDDDVWSPMKIRRQLETLGTARWGFASVIVVDEALDPLYALPSPEADTIPEALMLGNVVPGGPSNVIAQTAFVRSLGSFDESLSHSADWDLWLRLARAEAPAVSREVLVASLEHSQRMIFRDRPDLGAESKRLFDKHGGASRHQQLAIAEWLAAEHRSAGNYAKAARIYGSAGVRFRSPGNIVAAAGALFGERGLRAVSRLLVRTRGATHLYVERLPVPTEPHWLGEFRAGSVARQ